LESTLNNIKGKSMELWQQMVRDSIHTVDQLVEKFNIDRKVAEDLDEFFQARINP